MNIYYWYKQFKDKFVYKRSFNHIIMVSMFIHADNVIFVNK